MPTQVKIPLITGPPALASRDRPRVLVWSLLPLGQQPG
jgi:hypothetical protein